MKKKLFSVVIAFVSILFGTVLLTACGDKEPPTLTGIGIIYNNQEYNTSSSYHIGYFEKGSNMDLTYKVYALYSDNSKTELDSSKYSVKYYKNSINGEEELASLTQPLELGDYSIKISYSNFSCSIDFGVEKAQANYQLSVTGSRNIYYGQALPTLQVVNTNGINLSEEDIFYELVPTNEPENATAPTEEEINGQVWSIDSSATSLGINPGSYFIYARINEQQDYKQGRTNFVRFTVKKGQLEFTNLSEKITEFTFTYSGGISGDVDINILDKTVELYNKYNTSYKEYYDLTVVRLGEVDNLNYATYHDGVVRQFKITLDTDKYEEIEWNCTITVEKGVIEIPTINDGVTFVYLDAGEVSTWWSLINITRDSQTITISNSDGASQATLNDTITEPGTYTYTLSLVDPDNYSWSDGTTAPINLVLTKN